MHVKMYRGGCFVSDRIDHMTYLGNIHVTHTNLSWSTDQELRQEKFWHIFRVDTHEAMNNHTKINDYIKMVTEENFYAGPFKSSRIADKVIQSVLDIESHTSIRWETCLHVRGRSYLNQYIIKDIGLNLIDADGKEAIEKYAFPIYEGNNIDTALIKLKKYNDKYYTYIMHPLNYMETLARAKVNKEMSEAKKQVQKLQIEISKKDDEIISLRSFVRSTEVPRRRIIRKRNGT